MLGDAVTAKKQEGTAREDVEVVDVAQLMLRSVHRNITVVPVDGDQAASAGAAPDAGPATA
jgi:hypothetical protein